MKENITYDKKTSQIKEDHNNSIMKDVFSSILRGFKPEPEHLRIKPSVAPTIEVDVPKTKRELVNLLKRTSGEVLSREERIVISSALSFATRRVREIMLPVAEALFLRDTEFLGPLTLDKLYKTGLTHFPVVDGKENIIGVLHADRLLNLEVKSTDRARKHLDENIYYLREDYTCEMALAAFFRTSAQIFIVIDGSGEAVGILTPADLVFAIFGRDIQDDFDKDASKTAVMGREV
jgi:CBS domain containing-hemolysin-like protein